MKKFILSSLIVVASILAQAKTINSQEKLTLVPSEIDQVIRLVDKKDPGSSHKKLSIVVTDHGMSTDVSPRHTVYLGYASLAEMGNISADFLITDQALRFVSAERIEAGIYEVKTIEYRSENEDDVILEVTHRIDATKMFSDEKKLRNNCGDSFCDETLKTSIQVEETVKPGQF